MQPWIILDIIIIVIFAICIQSGTKKGFMRSAYQILSVIATIVIVLMFRAPATEFLSSTQIGENVKFKVSEAVDKILTNQDDSKTLSDVLAEMNLPEFIAKNVESSSQTIENTKDNISASVTDSITNSIMSAVSVLLLFLIVRLLLWVVIITLDALCKLPVLNFVNKAAGTAMGIVNALLIIYIICALFTLISPIENMEKVNDAVNKTYLTKYFYENNFLMELFM